MKPWIKRSLFGFAGAAIVAGSLGGCAAHRFGGGDPAEFRAKMVERIGGKLDLDTAQMHKLAALAEKLGAQRAAMRDAGGAGGTRTQFQSLFAGNRLDQQAATKMVDEKTAAVRTGSPEIIAAAADFFDNLNATQQAKVREFMERGGRRWGHRG